MEKVFDVIGSVFSAIGGFLDWIFRKIQPFFKAVVNGILWLAEKIMLGLGWVYEHLSANKTVFTVVMGVLIVLGVVLFIWSAARVIGEIDDDEDDEEKSVGRKRKKKKDPDRFVDIIESLPLPGAEHLAGFTLLYKYIMIAMYYPCALVVGMFCAVSGQGQLGYFDAIVNGEMAYNFGNFLLWDGAAKYLWAFVLVKGAMRVVSCLLRLDFLRLLRTVTLTLDVFLLGTAVGHFYLFLKEASSDSFLLGLVFLVVGFLLYIIYPLILIAFIAPITAFVAPVLVLVVIPFGMIFGGFAAGNWGAAKSSAFARGDSFTYEAMDRAEQGKIGMLLFLDVLGL